VGVARDQHGFVGPQRGERDGDVSAELTAGFGSVWQTMGVALKFYSCVGSNHTTLDALRDLQAEHPFGPKDVKSIVVHGSQVTLDHAGWKYRPAGIASAQMNLSFCVATLLLEGDCFVGQFGEKPSPIPGASRSRRRSRCAPIRRSPRRGRNSATP
jgi:2-methylcitrate dehydratase PrpD